MTSPVPRSSRDREATIGAAAQLRVGTRSIGTAVLAAALEAARGRMTAQNVTAYVGYRQDDGPRPQPLSVGQRCRNLARETFAAVRALAGAVGVIKSNGTSRLFETLHGSNLAPGSTGWVANELRAAEDFVPGPSIHSPNPVAETAIPFVSLAVVVQGLRVVSRSAVVVRADQLNRSMDRGRRREASGLETLSGLLDESRRSGQSRPSARFGLHAPIPSAEGLVEDVIADLRATPRGARSFTEQRLTELQADLSAATAAQGRDQGTGRTRNNTAER